MRDLAIFTQVYNETTMLPLWEKHYSSQVGYDDIYIFDHGSTEKYNLTTRNIIRIERDEYCDVEKIRFFEATQTELLKRYRYVLCTDCDEFIVARPGRYQGLKAFIRETNEDAYRCTGIDVVQASNLLKPVEWDKPILRQRPYGSLRHWSCKTLLARVPLSWQPGLHACNLDLKVHPDLWLFHFKHADLDRLLQRLAVTRALKWSQLSLQSNLGASHRVSDAAMLAVIDSLQATKTEADLDSFDAEAILAGPKQTPLARIPEEFLDSL